MYGLYIWHRVKDHEQIYLNHSFERLVHLTQRKWSSVKLLISYFCTSCQCETKHKIMIKIFDILLLYVLYINREQKTTSKIFDILLFHVSIILFTFSCHHITNKSNVRRFLTRLDSKKCKISSQKLFSVQLSSFTI